MVGRGCGIGGWTPIILVTFVSRPWRDERLTPLSLTHSHSLSPTPLTLSPPFSPASSALSFYFLYNTYVIWHFFPVDARVRYYYLYHHHHHHHHHYHRRRDKYYDAHAPVWVRDRYDISAASMGVWICKQLSDLFEPVRTYFLPWNWPLVWCARNPININKFELKK